MVWGKGRFDPKPYVYQSSITTETQTQDSGNMERSLELLEKLSKQIAHLTNINATLGKKTLSEKDKTKQLDLMNQYKGNKNKIEKLSAQKSTLESAINAVRDLDTAKDLAECYKQIQGAIKEKQEAINLTQVEQVMAEIESQFGQLQELTNQFSTPFSASRDLIIDEDTLQYELSQLAEMNDDSDEDQIEENTKLVDEQRKSMLSESKYEIRSHIISTTTPQTSSKVTESVHLPEAPRSKLAPLTSSSGLYPIIVPTNQFFSGNKSAHEYNYDCDY